MRLELGTVLIRRPTPELSQQIGFMGRRPPVGDVVIVTSVDGHVVNLLWNGHAIWHLTDIISQYFDVA